MARHTLNSTGDHSRLRCIPRQHSLLFLPHHSTRHLPSSLLSRSRLGTRRFAMLLRKILTLCTRFLQALISPYFLSHLLFPPSHKKKTLYSPPYNPSTHNSPHTPPGSESAGRNTDYSTACSSCCRLRIRLLLAAGLGGCPIDPPVRGLRGWRRGG